MDFRVKCEKYSKRRHYTFKNFQMVKLCEIVVLYQDFENLS